MVAVKLWIAWPPNRSSASSDIATVTLALLSLFLFGGHAIHSFTATMIFGVVLVGTYTSVFIAAPILIYLGVKTHGEEPVAQEGAAARAKAHA